MGRSTSGRSTLDLLLSSYATPRKAAGQEFFVYRAICHPEESAASDREGVGTPAWALRLRRLDDLLVFVDVPRSPRRPLSISVPPRLDRQRVRVCSHARR